MSPPSPPKGSGMGIEARPSTSRLLGWMANKHASPRLKESGYILFFLKNKQTNQKQLGSFSNMTSDWDYWSTEKLGWSWNLYRRSMNLCNMQGWGYRTSEVCPSRPQIHPKPTGLCPQNPPWDWTHQASGIPNSHAFRSQIFPINCYQWYINPSFFLAKS